MRRVACSLFIFLLSLPLLGQSSTQSAASRVAEDARVLRRLAEVAGNDFPRPAAKKIAEEDLELLRGRRSDGTYEYAHYEREESSRIEDRQTIRTDSADKLETAQIAGEIVYRLTVEVPSRRLLVARNRRVYVDNVEITYRGFDNEEDRTVTEVDAWLLPGDRRTFDIPVVAKRATAKVRARVDKEDGGPASLDLALSHATLVDDTRSPYFESVQRIRSLQTAIDRRNSEEVQSLSTDLMRRLGGSSGTEFTVEATRTDGRETPALTSDRDLYLELQQVEDLLMGNAEERRDGMDRLHQIVRRLRPR